ncbi:hypothetical protein E4U19_003079 [Claviceps sp. Clav32 group G5]|nr:hypothetical protein E4U19_003079 [Claviceps sp. Clav32 group G5]
MSAPSGPDRQQKPGAAFAFKPKNTMASLEEPAFFSSAVRHTNDAKGASPGQGLSQQHHSSAGALRDITTKINDRVPPKQAAASQPSTGYDFDDDFDKLHRAFGSIKTSVLKDVGKSHLSSKSSSRPAFGHGQKMMSSRKQKADVFIRQKSRPEHHREGTKISGPKPPSYQVRKPPPMPVYDSNSNSLNTTISTYAEEVFYTDPSKASADLKALLEGGMEDEEGDEGEDGEEEEEEEEEKEEKKRSDEASAETLKHSQSESTWVEQSPGAEAKQKEESPKTKPRRKSPIGIDGTVEGLKVKLLPHQVEGVDWMRGRELGPVKRGRVPKGGLLADDMGLGKTLQSVSLMLTNRKPEKGSPGWKKAFENVVKTTLVVAPLSLIRQWEHEIADKVASLQGLKVLVHHGPQRTKDFKELAKYDVVVTTYHILVSEFGKADEAGKDAKAGCFGLHWWRVILDEAHTIKNRNAKSTKACYALRSEYRWCLSGTPMQNTLDDLQSLVRFLRIKPYDDLKQWKEHIDTPLKNGRGHIAIRRLHSVLRCFMKRRTKEILKKDGALNPGGKPSAKGEASATGFKHTERKIVMVSAKLTPAERRFYDRLEARADRNMEAMMQNKVSYANAFTLLLRLRQVCNHPKLVEGKLEKDSDALSGGFSQKSQNIDMNAVADMFAGMGITTKNCSICGVQLSLDHSPLRRDHCADCQEDLDLFNGPAHEQKLPLRGSRRKKSKNAKQAQSKKIVAKAEREMDASPIQRTQRRARNRNAIIDSDDEEEEQDGSWLVPEEERGDLRLGKTGGEADENAEGGGDWIRSDDSDADDDDSDIKDQSDLSSFVVDDETAKKEQGYQSVDEACDDSLLSVDALTQAMAAQTLSDTKPSKANGKGRAESITIHQDEEDASSDEQDTAVESNASSFLDEDDYNCNGGGGGQYSQVGASAKIREMSKILQKEAHQHKFIVFSQFTSMLDLVEPFLDADGFEYVRYDGSMKNDAREESLRRLRQDDETRILLCSLKCGSLGLNLTAATRVIIVEPFWNPFVEEQAIDRVHRLNQTMDVVVYKLTVEDTVEERILDLQNKKRELAEQTIEGGARKENFKLGINEIINLFKSDGHHDARAPPPGPLEDRQRLMGGRMQEGGVLKKKAAREESAVFGRRW